MTASGLPAVLIKLAMSVGPALFSWDAFVVVSDLDDIADIAESMEEFLLSGPLLTRSARTADGPAMAEVWPEEEPGGGCCISPVIELLRSFEDFGLNDESGLIHDTRC